jgi:hypothetical protein
MCICHRQDSAKRRNDREEVWVCCGELGKEETQSGTALRYIKSVIFTHMLARGGREELVQQRKESGVSAPADHREDA